MKAHPYIKYRLANAIFQYRQQHGNYISVEQIKKILIITDEMYQKAAPYLSVE
jgi:DNA uptake protein ComE-like DNA-binding protein